MTRLGHIRNGMIVLEKPVELPDGARVEVEVKPLGTPAIGLDKIEKLTEGINYDFEAVERLRMCR